MEDLNKLKESVGEIGTEQLATVEKGMGEMSKVATDADPVKYLNSVNTSKVPNRRSYRTYSSSSDSGEGGVGALGLFGILLICFAIPIVWFNERKSVKMDKLYGQAGRNVKSLKNVRDGVNYQNHYQLVHCTGMLETAQPISDPQFGI